MRLKAGRVTWAIEDYASEVRSNSALMSKEQDVRLLQDFPPCVPVEPGKVLPMVGAPAVFADVNGVIMAWSLPDALLPHICVRLSQQSPYDT